MTPLQEDSIILNLSPSDLVQGRLFSFTVQLRTQAVLLWKLVNMSNLFNENYAATDDTGDVKIVIKGNDCNKSSNGASSIYAFCNHCKKDISVVYIKSDAKGKELEVAETTMKTNWPAVNDGSYPENDYDKCKKNNDYESCKKLLDEKKKSGKIHDLWVSFLDSCTLHGFHFCFAGNPPIRRVLWTLLLLGAFSLFVEKCLTSVYNYFDYPFTTTTVIVYESSMVFPAISICNYNDARLSAMNGTLMNELYVRKNIDGRNSSDIEGNITGKIMQDTLSKAAHRLDRMLLECNYGKDHKCDHNNFTEFKNAFGDVCFTFNSGKNGSKILNTTNTGQDRGLRLLIDLQHYEYYYAVESAGFRVILHDQAETPVKMQGYAVAPGFTTYMELQKKQVGVSIIFWVLLSFY